jgi:hypothetical protein
VGFFFKVLKMKQNNKFNFLQMAQTWCYKQCLLRGSKGRSVGFEQRRTCAYGSLLNWRLALLIICGYQTLFLTYPIKKDNIDLKCALYD